MEIVSWNCLNGFDKKKQEAILDEFPKADIIVIQECKRKDMDTFKYNWKYKNWYGDDQDYKSDLGVAIFSKNYNIDFTDEFNRKFRYVVPYKVVVANEKSLTLFTVWTKSAKRGKFNYDENIFKAIESSEYQKYFKDDVIFIGDFNTGYIEKYPERYTKLQGNLKTKEFTNCSSGKSEEFKKTFYYDRYGKEYTNDYCFFSKNLYSRTKENLVIKVHDDWKNKNGVKRWHGLSDHCPISVKFEL